MKILDVGDRRRFEALDDSGELLGFLAYRQQGELMDLVHTEVLPIARGKGVGAALVRHVLDEAKDRSLSVGPTCPFVKTYIEKHPAYLALVPEDRRDGISAPNACDV